ncbi:septal ring lytic transglycosylase RlpA family protein [Anabaena cylindrica FACHB-243]|uniref:Probable endolytic peptidoglycan transglycosylase RlpA n=1 Tax=Anabaena cylindrica (strain ATCC 27899 / PCC 7122) TaxID=272123 RepID=K9Z9D0_ANACC|nr:MULTISPECIES: septal ring lytic transglycosylase RlpA family protein [Anabaena]AFZ55771.1 rare lipoprotein A [Anabaena cylindrica PCC 7122]MBD2420228.1 septal ring lytic transglycosylase RlpA family protein [Anabaena cylindrica FACHB-243]MBY5283099.1 septal ring lytic transglycosylase RlpA family protein [Anabaena sp. CCAP 1446/1C]MBY5307816.1 septal ring lytic transglycosylase RlpA family protein [Anabaena sp. CCAP 1446/1C]MCM2406120.1 septal ring lytic transglycosylase RlpA family protein
MNQRHLWTTAALFLTVLGTPSVGLTQTTEENTPTSPASALTDVVKVGEYQSPAQKPTLDAVKTDIHPHSIGGRQAATLYIRNIPVLTFLSSAPVTSAETKVGAVANGNGVKSYALVSNNSAKVASIGNVIDVSKSPSSIADDPVQRASVVAARINQLIDENVDASQITVSWKTTEQSPVNNKAQDKTHSVKQQLDRYTIKVDGQELVEINQGTQLADSTKDLARDALQATNRLRRLIGNASPISEIANLPVSTPALTSKLPQQIARGFKINFQGIASWYGYDWAGRKTANGERFNPDAMTAAHRSLPMGTQVRVTNTRNNRSVVVRINDRGPYIGGRIIDVSIGAARLLGMVGSGVAPVRIDILGR